MNFAQGEWPHWYSSALYCGQETYNTILCPGLGSKNLILLFAGWLNIIILQISSLFCRMTWAARKQWLSSKLVLEHATPLHFQSGRKDPGHSAKVRGNLSLQIQNSHDQQFAQSQERAFMNYIIWDLDKEGVDKKVWASPAWLNTRTTRTGSGNTWWTCPVISWKFANKWWVNKIR